METLRSNKPEVLQGFQRFSQREASVQTAVDLCGVKPPQIDEQLLVTRGNRTVRERCHMCENATKIEEFVFSVTDLSVRIPQLKIITTCHMMYRCRPNSSSFCSDQLSNVIF